jgi:hypothetical protein
MVLSVGMRPGVICGGRIDFEAGEGHSLVRGYEIYLRRLMKRSSSECVNVVAFSIVRRRHDIVIV